MARGYGSFSIEYSKMKRAQERARNHIYSLDEDTLKAVYGHALNQKPNNDFEKFAKERLIYLGKSDEEKLKEDKERLKANNLKLYYEMYPQEKEKDNDILNKHLLYVTIAIIVMALLNNLLKS